MLYNLTIIVFCFVILMSSCAEQTYNYSSRRAIKRTEQIGKDLIAIENYKGALRAWLTLDSIEADNPMYQYYLGLCYLNLEREDEALTLLEPLRRERGLPEDAAFTFAKAYHLNYQFETAIQYYNSYQRKLESDDPSYETVKRQLEMCENGLDIIRDTVPVRVQNLGQALNTSYYDYGPLISIDEQLLIFTSRREGTTGNSYDPSINEFFEDIYLSQKVDGRWTFARSISKNVNTPLHDAAVGLSPIGGRLILYRGDDNPLNPRRSGDLYFSDRTDTGWTAPVAFNDNINTRYWEPSASLTYDEKIMYFASDRPGGYGGTDIYMVQSLPDGTWAQPVNMGPVINTPFDEDGPFINADGNVLYFSSKGHKSMGGFDIFTSTFDSLAGIWSNPVNIGYPINTPDDDIYFVFSNDGKRAYFSSSREDTYGQTDIYLLTREDIAGTTAIINGTVKTINGGAVVTEMVVEDEERVAGVYLTDGESGRYNMVLETGHLYTINLLYGDYEIPIQLDLRDVIPDSELRKDIFVDL